MLETSFALYFFIFNIMTWAEKISENFLPISLFIHLNKHITIGFSWQKQNNRTSTLAPGPYHSWQVTHLEARLSPMSHKHMAHNPFFTQSSASNERTPSRDCLIWKEKINWPKYSSRKKLKSKPWNRNQPSQVQRAKNYYCHLETEYGGTDWATLQPF